MEFLTYALMETVSELNDDQKEEIDVIESIVNVSEENKEEIKEKIKKYIEKRVLNKFIVLILSCIEHAALIRPKKRELLHFLSVSVFDNFHLNHEILNKYVIIKNMFQVKGILPTDTKTDCLIFDLSKKGSIKRAIIEDDVDSLQQILVTSPNEGTERVLRSTFWHTRSTTKIDFFYEGSIRIEDAAFFGSVKCFKYLMMNNDTINDDTCKFAVAGGNHEIVHLCEQQGLQFNDCLHFSSMFHQFEIYEWLQAHFIYDEILLTEFLRYFNEPLFYFCLENGVNVETKDDEGNAPLNVASKKGELEVVKYLYEICHADVETKDNWGNTPIHNASEKGELELVKYLYETCHAYVETKDNYGRTPIHNASINGHLEIVKYLYETCHANVETKDELDGHTPIHSASLFGHLDIVKYLYETCHVNVELKDNEKKTPLYNALTSNHLDVFKYLCEKCHADINIMDTNYDTPINYATLKGNLELVKYLYETCHANVEISGSNGRTPINNASSNGHLEIVKYLYETCHANIETRDFFMYTPIDNAAASGNLDIIIYLKNTCHAKVTEKTFVSAKNERVKEFLRPVSNSSCRL